MCRAYFLLTVFPTVIEALKSHEIPRGSSKMTVDSTECGWTVVPPPVLQGCTEEIWPGLPNHVGIWIDPVAGIGNERIEQCGDRYVVSGLSPPYFAVHDFPHADGSAENGLDDYKVDAMPGCVVLDNVRAKFDGNCLNLTSGPSGAFTGATRCLLDDGTLRFVHNQFGIDVILTRLDDLPEGLEEFSPTTTPTTSPASSVSFFAWTSLCLLGFIISASLFMW